MKKPALAFLATLAVVQSALAQLVTFDPDGAGTANQAQQISGFNFRPGNALAHNAVPFVVGATFQLYQQMAVEALLDDHGNPFVPAGLNTNFELTVISSVTYMVTSINSAGTTRTVTAAAAATQASNSFVQMLYDTPPNADPLRTDSYNGGTIILSARPSATGNISFVEQRNPDGSSQAVVFDQFGPNNYPNALTIRATGNASTLAEVNGHAQQFFSSYVHPELITSFDTPFTATNPSGKFVEATSSAATLAPNRGGLNGANGPDFQLQTRSTMSFQKRAVGLVVTTLDDHNDGVCNSDCTLREAIIAATSQIGKSISFASGLAGTIELAGALPDLSTNITITGPGANLLTVRRNTGGNYRIFTISNGTTTGPRVTLRGLTIANGQATGSPANGGGILNDAGNLYLTQCALIGNHATNGGGLYNRGGAGSSQLSSIYRCTFSGNVATGYGGAMFNVAPQSLEAKCYADSSTISGNLAGSGAAIRSSGSVGVASAALQSCTVSGNTGPQAATVVDGATSELVVLNSVFNAASGGASFSIINGGKITSHGGNISSDAAGGSTTSNAPGGVLSHQTDNRNTDLKLDPAGLRYNGGPTETIALQSDSPAVNHAISKTSSLDQRGMFRGDQPDAGAFELGGTLPVTLANIATRMRVGTGNDALIGGFIVTGTQPKRLLVRAIGPSSFLPGALQDPQLEVYNSAGALIGANDNWQDSPDRQAIINTGVPPLDKLESAVIRSATPGAYTAIVRGANGSTGLGLVEVYDLDRTVDSKLANISTRGRVEKGDNVMIGGFIVVGDGTFQNLIVRAIGPSLNLPGKLLDPVLQLYDANGKSIAYSDDWRTNQENEIIDTMVAPSNDHESAIVRRLPAGNYTAIVSGKNDTTGIAVVEVYALD